MNDHFSEIQKEAMQFAHKGRIESYSRIIPWIPEDVKLLLDVGSGYGLFQGMLPERITSVSIDLYPRREHVVMADMHNMPFGNGSLDCVFYSHSLEHSHIPVVALSEANRVLRVGGYILLIIPSYFDPPQLTHVSHWSVFPTQTWMEIFKRLGFVNLKHEFSSYFWEQESGDRIYRLEEFYLFKKERDL